MAPVPKNTKSHFTHPNHPLVYHSDHQDYTCNGCKTSGSGSRFRCHPCDFDLHEYCANCPEKLPSSSIHHHLLTLVLRKPGGDRLNERICDVCRDPVDGLFYRCKDCDFDAHPLCTQLPKELHHAADNIHPLKLRKPPSGSCAVCKKNCSSLWVYGCDICRVNIHPDCLLEPYESLAATRMRVPPAPQPGLERSGSGTTSRGIPPPWAAGPAPFPGGGYPWNDGYYGNFGMGKHYGADGYADPYSVPDYNFAYPNYGYMNHPTPGQAVYEAPPHSYMNHPTPGQAVYEAPPHSYMNHPTPGLAVYEAPPPRPSSRGRKTVKSMFSLVSRITLGVATSVIFGGIGF